MSAIFNGTNSYLSLSSGFGLAGTTTFQAMCWFKTSTAQGALWTLGNSTSGDYRAGQMATTRTPRARSQNVSPASAANASAGSGASSNTWAAAAHQFDTAAFRRAAINGTLGTSNTTTVSNIDAPDYFWVGREDDLSPVYFTGEIAYIVVHTGIGSSYITNAASTSYDPLRFITDLGSTLLALYLLDGNGNDSSGNGYHLTANNITWGSQPFTFPSLPCQAADQEDASTTVRVAVSFGASCGDAEDALVNPRLTVEPLAYADDNESASATMAIALNALLYAGDREDATASPSVEVEAPAQAADLEDASVTFTLDVECLAYASDEDVATCLVLGIEADGFVAYATDRDDASAVVSVLVEFRAAAADSEDATATPSLAVSASATASDVDDATAAPSLSLSASASASDVDSALASFAVLIVVDCIAVDTETATAVAIYQPPPTSTHSFRCRAVYVDQMCSGVLEFAQPVVAAAMDQGAFGVIEQCDVVLAVEQMCGRVEIDQ